MYSNVICIGDSYTNEIETFKPYQSEFKKAGYEFKSYPQLLGEYYNCKGNFGHLCQWFTLQTLIDNSLHIIIRKSFGNISIWVFKYDFKC